MGLAHTGCMGRHFPLRRPCRPGLRSSTELDRPSQAGQNELYQAMRGQYDAADPMAEDFTWEGEEDYTETQETAMERRCAPLLAQCVPLPGHGPRSGVHVQSKDRVCMDGLEPVQLAPCCRPCPWPTACPLPRLQGKGGAAAARAAAR